jgi:hypothetical protein
MFRKLIIHQAIHQEIKAIYMKVNSGSIKELRHSSPPHPAHFFFWLFSKNMDKTRLLPVVQRKLVYPIKLQSSSTLGNEC